MSDESMLRHLMSCEEWLLHTDHQKDPAALEQALSDELEEVAPNGQRVSRAQVIHWLLNKSPLARWQFNEARASLLNEQAVLLHYHARQVGGPGRRPGSAGSRRCSLWCYNEALGAWQLSFHQATPLVLPGTT